MLAEQVSSGLIYVLRTVEELKLLSSIIAREINT